MGSALTKQRGAKDQTNRHPPPDQTNRHPPPCANPASSAPGMDKDWDDLTGTEREAAKLLGYAKQSWDQDKDTKVTETDWADLSHVQRGAAITLGYSRATWDEVDGSRKKQVPGRKGETKTRGVGGGSRGGSGTWACPC